MASPSSSKRARTTGQSSSPPNPPSQNALAATQFALPSTNVGATTQPTQTNSRKRRLSHSSDSNVAGPSIATNASAAMPPPETPVTKKARTNTPWTADEEQRLKTMRDAGNSWGVIAKSFPARTEGSVKKHWYKDMHYAEWTDDEKEALKEAIRQYEAEKWKTIGQRLNKPAKACEQYAKEHFKN